MLSKLVNMSKENQIAGVGIRVACRMGFGLIAVWNEITAFSRAHNIGGRKYQSLLQYKEKHKGERCFIIATGPSLTEADLERLKDEYTFGMNSICRVYSNIQFRPTYYGIQDHLVYEKLQKDIFKSYGDCDNVFVSDRISRLFPIGEHWNVFPLAIAYNAYDRWFKNKFYAKFSDDVFRICYSGFSITASLIQIAVYMGFKEIYLLGADCNFAVGKEEHFVEHGVHDQTIDTAKARNIAGYLAAKEYADAHGIKIYNATRGGKLEVFERVDFDELMKNK